MSSQSPVRPAAVLRAHCARPKVARSTTPAVAPAPWQTCSYSATISRRACTTTNSCPSADRSPAAKETCESSTRNGAALRIWNLTSSSRSAARGGTSLKRTSETFAAASGRTSATRLGRCPRRSSAARIGAHRVAGRTTFGAVSEGTTAPSGSGSTAHAPSLTSTHRCPTRRQPSPWTRRFRSPPGEAGVRRIDGSFIRRTSPC